ncbi:MAG: ABC transporter permease subunit, partial [Eubacterium sp.]
MKLIKFDTLKFLFLLFFILTLILPLFSMFAAITKESLNNLLLTPVFWEITLRSVIVTLTATFISISLALALSFCVSKTAMPFKRILIPALTLPMLIPSISHGMGLVILFGAKGIFTGLFHVSFNLYGFFGIVIGSVLYTFPIAFLMLMDVFKYEDDSLYEAIQIMGASKLRQFTDLTLVYLKKPLIAAFFAVFTMIFTDYGVPLAVGGKYRVLSTYMYREVLGLLNFS